MGELLFFIVQRLRDGGSAPKPPKFFALGQGLRRQPAQKKKGLRPEDLSPRLISQPLGTVAAPVALPQSRILPQSGARIATGQFGAKGILNYREEFKSCSNIRSSFDLTIH